MATKKEKVRMSRRRIRAAVERNPINDIWLAKAHRKHDSPMVVLMAAFEWGKASTDPSADLGVLLASWDECLTDAAVGQEEFDGTMKVVAEAFARGWEARHATDGPSVERRWRQSLLSAGYV